jgi:predicted O-linked N-acetylglucosamine transferase (SPINDLY family)
LSTHYHFFAGSGHPTPIQEPLEAAGLMSRVRFLGFMGDIAILLEMTDLYLNTFSVSGGQSVLEPMAAAKPVVIFRHAKATHCNAGAELAGIEEVSVYSADDYVELAAKLIEDPALRRQYGKRLQDRFHGNFRPTDLGPKCIDFMREVIEQSWN